MTVLGIADAGPDPLTDGIRTAISETAEEIGLTPVMVRRPEDEGSIDIMLIVGYPRTYARFLEATHRSRRIAWFGEPLPPESDSCPGSGVRTSGTILASASMARGLLGPLTRRALPGRLRGRREGAAIAYEQASNLADARWCSRLVDRVVVTSEDRGRVLAASGVPATVIPYGYHPALAGPLAALHGRERDMAVVTLGAGMQTPHLRRGRIFSGLRPALEALGSVTCADGVWGAERDAMLQRTRIILDIHRAPGNFAGLRYLTAFAAGAVLVGEPLADPRPFIPGIDHVEAPVEGLVKEVAALLDDEPARLAMATRAQYRIGAELTMRSMLQRVLAA